MIKCEVQTGKSPIIYWIIIRTIDPRQTSPRVQLTFQCSSTSTWIPRNFYISQYTYWCVFNINRSICPSPSTSLLAKQVQSLVVDYKYNSYQDCRYKAHLSRVNDFIYLHLSLSDVSTRTVWFKYFLFTSVSKESVVIHDRFMFNSNVIWSWVPEKVSSALANSHGMSTEGGIPTTGTTNNSSVYVHLIASVPLFVAWSWR